MRSRSARGHHGRGEISHANVPEPPYARGPSLSLPWRHPPAGEAGNLHAGGKHAAGAVHHATAAEWKVWTQAALAFATIYALLTGTVYYGQLTYVAPHMLRGDMAGILAILFRRAETLAAEPAVFAG